MNAPLRSLLAAGLLLIGACASVEQGPQVDCDVQPVPPDWDRTVAPNYFPERVERFREALLETDGNIRVMEAEELWQTIFADRDQSAAMTDMLSHVESQQNGSTAHTALQQSAQFFSSQAAGVWGMGVTGRVRPISRTRSTGRA